MRKSSLMAVCALLAIGVSACAMKGPSQGQRIGDVTIRVAPESVSVKAPPYIGSGDSVRVRVFDRTFANRYVVRDSLMTLTALEVSAMTGDTALKAMSLAFSPGLVQGISAPEKERDEQERLERLEESGLKFRRGARTPRQEYNRLLIQILQTDSQVIAASDSMVSTLESLRPRVRADRGEYSRITLLANTDWQIRAAELANDPAATAAKRRLDTAAQSKTDSILGPADLFTLRRDLELYGRRLDLFRASLPAEPPAALSDTSSVPGFMERLARLSERDRRLRAHRDMLVAQALGAAERARIEPRIPNAPPAAPPLLVIGMNLTPLLTSPSHLLEQVDTARVRLERVNQATVRVVTAANQLPRWTMTSDTSTIFTSLYPTEKEVRVLVMRRNRFAAWGTGAAEAAAKPASTTTSSGGTTITTTTTVTQGGAAAAASTGSTGAAAAGIPLVVVPRQDDTVAVVTIPVLQRYRYRLGVGLLYSTLNGLAIETPEDTVDGKPGQYVHINGRNQHRIVPVALLSATLFPFEGRYVDGRARRYPLQNMSASLQAGVSLQDPTEHIYAGFAVEPVQGLEIGVGAHVGYVETTIYESGSFVPFSEGTATGSKWKSAVAYSVTLDATTFVRAFGSVLGL